MHGMHIKIKTKIVDESVWLMRQFFGWEAGNPGSQWSVSYFVTWRPRRHCYKSLKVITFTKYCFLCTYQSTETVSLPSRNSLATRILNHDPLVEKHSFRLSNELLMNFYMYVDQYHRNKNIYNIHVCFGGVNRPANARVHLDQSHIYTVSFKDRLIL